MFDLLTTKIVIGVFVLVQILYWNIKSKRDFAVPAFIILFYLQMVLDWKILATPDFLELYLQIAGLSLISPGVIVVIWTREVMATNWNSQGIKTFEKQKLITDGPFKFVRHPIYSGIILMVVGLELLLQSWLFAIVGLILSAAFYILTEKEEKYLLEKFGEDYGYYLEKTARFFPFLKL